MTWFDTTIILEAFCTIFLIRKNVCKQIFVTDTKNKITCVCWKGSNVYICVSSFSSLSWCRPVDHDSKDDHHCQCSNSNTSCQACGNDHNQRLMTCTPVHATTCSVAAVALVLCPHPFWKNQDSSICEWFNKLNDIHRITC